MLIEFKKINKRRNEILEQAVEKALSKLKVNSKKYNVELKELGINNILELAIAFDGKEVMMKENLT